MKNCYVCTELKRDLWFHKLWHNRSSKRCLKKFMKYQKLTNKLKGD